MLVVSKKGSSVNMDHLQMHTNDAQIPTWLNMEAEMDHVLRDCCFSGIQLFIEDVSETYVHPDKLHGHRQFS